MQGHIRQRGKRSWAIVLELGRDTSGKRRQRWYSGHRTKKDAQRELARLLHTLHSGAYVEPYRATVAEYLEQWLKDYAKTNVTAKTFERYAEIARLHLVPNLGHYALSKLHPLHIVAYYTSALQTGRRDGRGGLSAQTVTHHHRVLHGALQQAVKWQLLARNPADAVEPPRSQRKEMCALDEPETARLLNAAKGTRLYMPILLAVTTGMRRGEILGLRWQDLDLTTSMLSVRQSLEQTKARVAFKQPKTVKGRRVIALPQITVEALHEHKKEQAKQRLLLGPDYRDHGLVLANVDGTPWAPNSFTSSYRSLVARLGLAQIRFHDLRHTHATQLLRQGVHPKVVSERLGHSSIGITLDVYSHVLPGMQEDAARRIDVALRTALQEEAKS